MSGKHVIELNGKHYDTATGKLVHKTPLKSPSHAAHKPAKTGHAPAHANKKASIDGFHKPAHTARRANHVAPRPVQRSQTLMRAAARPAPVAVATPIVTPAGPVVMQSDQSTTLVGVDEARLKRAQKIHQNKYIGKFSAAASPAVTIEPTPVTPVRAKAPVPPVQTTQTTPPAPKSQLDVAIDSATSHQQHRATKKHKAHKRIARALHVKPRAVSVAAVSMLVIAVSGMLLYQNLPNLQMRLASSRSGVSGNIPSYIPSGFDLGEGISYKEGEITLRYQSKANDDRQFSVTQAESFWTSESLRDNYLETLDTNYQTIQANGKTIYLYEDGATWVDGGIWYRVDTKGANLSSSQLTDLVNGL